MVALTPRIVHLLGQAREGHGAPGQGGVGERIAALRPGLGRRGAVPPQHQQRWPRVWGGQVQHDPAAEGDRAQHGRGPPRGLPSRHGAEGGLTGGEGRRGRGRGGVGRGRGRRGRREVPGGMGWGLGLPVAVGDILAVQRTVLAVRAKGTLTASVGVAGLGKGGLREGHSRKVRGVAGRIEKMLGQGG